MDRNALLLYLQNVRDLEIAKYELNKRHQADYNAYIKRKDVLNTKPKQRSLPEHPDEHIGSRALILIGIALLLSFPIRFIMNFFTTPDENAPSLSNSVVIISLVCIVGAVALTILLCSVIATDKKNHKQWEQDIANTKAENI